MRAGNADAHRVTMAEVAAAADVSVKTVSRVVNGEQYVTDAVAARVHEAVARLNYYPNPYAGRLRRKSVRDPTIGLLVSSVSNPFAASVHRAIEDVALRRHAVVLATSSDDEPEREHANMQTFLRRRVDGVIVAPTGHGTTHLGAVQRSGVALVFVDRRVDGIEADTVVTDNVLGASMATKLLLEHGHRRLAFLGDRSIISTAIERRRGFEESALAAGIAAEDLTIVTGLHGVDEAFACTRELLQREPAPTAIFAAQNLVAIGAIRALHSLGMQRETALVAFDEVPFADILSPGITTVEQDPAAIGNLAATLVLARIGGDTGPLQRHVLRPRLVCRGSGEIRPPAR